MNRGAKGSVVDELENSIRRLQYRIELGGGTEDDRIELAKLEKRREIHVRKQQKAFEREAKSRGMSPTQLLAVKTNSKSRKLLEAEDKKKRRSNVRTPMKKTEEVEIARREEEIEVASEILLGLETNTLNYMAIARAVALASMPRKKLDTQRLSKVIRLGQSDWMVVSWVALRFEDGIPLPYHQDRLIYSGIVMETLKTMRAADKSDRVIRFSELQEVMALAEQAGIRTTGGKLARRLRDGLERLSSVMLLVDFYKTREDAEKRRNATLMTNVPLVRAFSLPTRQDVAASARGERTLGLDVHFIELGQDHWDYVRNPQNILWVPSVYLAALSDEPLALAVLLYLAARCQAAQSDVQEVPHEELLEIFNDHGGDDRFLFRDLTEAIDRVVKLTDGALRAELIEVPSKTKSVGRGRPKKRWALRVYRAAMPFVRRTLQPTLPG